MSIHAKISEWIDAASKVATPVGVAAILWLNSQYVTRSEFAVASERLSNRVEKIEQVLIRMEASAITDKRHDDLLVDHETRIRTLEKGSKL